MRGAKTLFTGRDGLYRKREGMNNGQIAGGVIVEDELSVSSDV